MATSHITVLGGDLRQSYAAEYLSSCGFNVTCFQTPDFPYDSSIHIADLLSEALYDSPAILLPSPLSQDGTHLLQKNSSFSLVSLEGLGAQFSPDQIIFYNGMPAEFHQELIQRECILYNLSDFPEFSSTNSRLTAEGLLSEIIRYTPFSLQKTNILLIGYGRCGDAIGSLLSSIGAHVYVLEQDTKKQELAEQNGLLAISSSEKSTILSHCSLIVNTVPDTVLTPDDLQILSKNCYIFDIASAPFGFSSDITTEYSLPYFRLPGLPGKFSPQSAGIAIGKTIERMINHGI